MRGQTKLFIQLLLPSALSLGVVGLYFVFVFVSALTSLLESFGPLSNYYASLESFRGVLTHQGDVWGSTFRTIESTYAFRQVSSVILWGLFGAFVYLIVFGLGYIFEDAKVLNYTAVDQKTKKGIVQEMAKRSLLRTVIIMLWIIYTIVFLEYISPVATVAMDDAASNSNIPLVALFSLLLIVAAHVHIIFLRLSFLRPRIFH